MKSSYILFPTNIWILISQVRALKISNVGWKYLQFISQCRIREKLYLVILNSFTKKSTTYMSTRLREYLSQSDIHRRIFVNSNYWHFIVITGFKIFLEKRFWFGGTQKSLRTRTSFIQSHAVAHFWMFSLIICGCRFDVKNSFTKKNSSMTKLKSKFLFSKIGCENQQK